MGRDTDDSKGGASFESDNVQQVPLGSSSIGYRYAGWADFNESAGISGCAQFRPGPATLGSRPADSLRRCFLLRFFKPHEQPSLRLAVFEMHQHRGRILGWSIS